jgi:hypothetical protein
LEKFRKFPSPPEKREDDRGDPGQSRRKGGIEIVLYPPRLIDTCSSTPSSSLPDYPPNLEFIAKKMTLLAKLNAFFMGELRISGKGNKPFKKGSKGLTILPRVL